MQLTWDEIQSNAIRFSKRWKDAHNEEAQGQSFELDFLRVFGVSDPEAVGDFEYKVPLTGGKTGYIDYLWKKKLAIEMKSRGKDLSLAFSQLQNYMQHLPEDEIPDLWLVCDFENMRLCRRSTNEIWNFKTKDLRKHIRRFADIAGYETERIRDDQMEVNVKAAEKMAKLHDALKSHGYEGHDLEVYLVRLLFCLFADDTGIFPQDSFFRYLEASNPDGSDLSQRIGRLFEVLNLPEEMRAKRTLLSDELKQFRYINGGLFKDLLPTAEFDVKMRQTLIDCVNFDWNKISPAIFGAMFQGVMDKDQRRELGAHYTSEENILKLINPLFMDELWNEFDRVKTDPAALDHFHNMISSLKFLDPACGCGNFLIITYRELRRLEMEVLKMKLSRMAYAQGNILENPLEKEIRVSVNQFYGIEYEDFPCQIAQVGMWLMDHQMNNIVADHFGFPFVRLPLTESATIVHGNALRIDWEGVVPKRELSYILGNPPFVGFSMMTLEQKSDVSTIFPGTKNLDYVACWYMKAIQIVTGTHIQCAFVSTNSICQGEVVPVLWTKLLKEGIVLNFAYRTFVWTNEAKGKAAVHCIIVGFAVFSRPSKFIYESNQKIQAKNINPYLVDYDNVIVYAQRNPFGDAPKMVYGNKPADGGNLIIEADDYDDFIEKEPTAKKYIRQYIGAIEFLHNQKRYCLWLKAANPKDIKSMPLVMERIERCREMRANSVAAAIRKFADTPTLFAQITQPEGKSYIIVPAHSSSTRKYIPLGFVSPDIISSNALAHYGIKMALGKNKLISEDVFGGLSNYFFNLSYEELYDNIINELFNISLQLESRYIALPKT